MPRFAAPALLAVAVAASPALAAVAPPAGAFSCEEVLGPWKGRGVAELVAKWGEPTERKSKSDGRARLVYDLAAGSKEERLRTPAEEIFLPSHPADDPTDSKREVINTRALESPTVSVSKDEDGNWQTNVPAAPESGAKTPKVYVFETAADGTIVKVRCKY